MIHMCSDALYDFISHLCPPSKGQLPFLTHLHNTISALPSILKYISACLPSEKLPAPDLDSYLSASEKSQQVAWCAHVEANLGDLVVCTLLSFLFTFYTSNVTDAYVLLSECKLELFDIPHNSKHAANPTAILCPCADARIVSSAFGSRSVVEPAWYRTRRGKTTFLGEGEVEGTDGE